MNPICAQGLRTGKRDGRPGIQCSLPHRVNFGLDKLDHFHHSVSRRPKHKRTPWGLRESTFYFYGTRSSMSFPQACHHFILTPKFVTGFYSQSPLLWCVSSSVTMPVLICLVISDTRRGVEALRCRPPTVIADETPTGGHPRAVRTL